MTGACRKKSACPRLVLNIVIPCLTKLSAKTRAESPYQFSPMAERSVALGIRDPIFVIVDLDWELWIWVVFIIPYMHHPTRASFHVMHHSTSHTIPRRTSFPRILSWAKIKNAFSV